ncbi:MAG: alpha/beta hydrolase [Rhodospirillaceae bacterium]|jgi:acylglycerol lipase|nr:alpha/beta hydrolase [Rhodospirillaceae bacterium]MBT6202236.1 alpha/beta hydrolase [Rhodospirillaceae bacterium]MBT6512216.1 alpha/beta hydrolase [Rhodospirillaceae bacterium]MBT7612938.1 alpha/beta hydrolase [Rhodospirillaceae bacterium]MBT7649192.1 alpha/beta hydrolase [Rhodospirillaceae bacterium]
MREPALHEAEIITSDDTHLALKFWGSSGETQAVILALHGFNDYSNAFALPAEVWSMHGIATYAYDQRGFGESEIAGLWAGTETLTADVRQALALLAERHPGAPLFLLGDSMGGAVAAVTTFNAPPEQLDGIILIAPAVWGRDTMPWHYKASLWLAAHLAPAMKLSGSGLKIVPSDNIEMLRELGRDPLVLKETRADAIYGLVHLMDAALASAGEAPLPILLVYGENDQIVPPQPIARFAAGITGPVRIAVYPESYHMVLRDLARDIPLGDIATFVLDPGAPMPSGNETGLEALQALKPAS